MSRNGPNFGEEPRDPQPLYAVWAAYDVSTVRPERDITMMFRDAAAALNAELDALRAEHIRSQVALATSNEKVLSLREEVKGLRRIQLFAACVAVIGSILIGVGVNLLTSESSTPGWIMLLLGALLELFAIASPWWGRERQRGESPTTFSSQNNARDNAI